MNETEIFHIVRRGINMKKRMILFLASMMLLFSINSETVHAEKTEETKVCGGYNDVEFELPQEEETNSVPRTRSAVLPAAYDVRSILPMVRNQSAYETCWAFAANASAEASLIKKSFADKTIDLSEYQLIYFFYHHVTDPLGNTKGDKTEVAQEAVAKGMNFATVGGNSLFTTWALAGWQGAASENVLPYDTLDTLKTVNSSLAYTSEAHMQNAYYIKMTDQQSIKKMVMEYGAVNISYLESGSCRNNVYNSFYNASTTEGSGHAVTIVGWDDNFSKTHFNTQPEGDGAWLVRNSWGENHGDGGYFWLSYYDKSAEKMGIAFVFDFEKADNYDYNYQYDGGNGVHYRYVSSGSSVANIFKAYGSEMQKIVAVSIGLNALHVDYEIQIYKDPLEGEPASGTLMTTQTGNTGDYAGYFTIPLEKEVEIEPGHRFSVVFKLSKSSHEKIAVFVDDSYINGGWIKFVSSTDAGQSMVLESENWEDLHDTGRCARIKAFSNVDSLETELPTTPQIPEICRHPGREEKLTPADAATEKDGVIQYVCTDCGEILMSQKISAPEKLILGMNSYTYDGTGKEPSVRVYDREGKTIAKNYYTVSYPNGAKEAGKQTVKVTFKGDYTGTLIGSYQITIGKVQGLKVKSRSSTSVTLTWKKVKGASKYQIYRYNTGKKKYECIKTVSAKTASYTDKNREAGSIYRYKVRAYRTVKNSKSYSGYSDIVKTTTPPKKVQGLKVKNKTKNTITISWKKVSRADGYEIYRYDSNKKKFKKVAEVKKGSIVTYKDKNLKSGKAYSYAVRAYKKDGSTKLVGSFSSTRTGKTR